MLNASMMPNRGLLIKLLILKEDIRKAHWDEQQKTAFFCH
jgi:hypothetical protein